MKFAGCPGASGESSPSMAAGLVEARRMAVASVAPVKAWRLAMASRECVCTSGEIVGSVAAAVGHRDVEGAEHVVSVGHAGGADAVGDEDGFFRALGLEPQPHQLG